MFKVLFIHDMDIDKVHARIKMPIRYEYAPIVGFLTPLLLIFHVFDPPQQKTKVCMFWHPPFPKTAKKTVSDSLPPSLHSQQYSILLNCICKIACIIRPFPPPRKINNQIIVVL